MLCAFASYIILQRRFTKKHRLKPKIVGIMAESSVYFILPVSFFTVKSVVKQGE